MGATARRPIEWDDKFAPKCVAPSAMTDLDPALVARFAADLDALLPADAPVGIAVSGGPDSLALLLLAAAARPGRMAAATVDHRLRNASGAEAAFVAELCRQRDIPHRIIAARWETPPTANVPARARDERYALLGEWSAATGLAAIATAHHADDQAETLLMRMARGAGVGGLGGIRPVVRLGGKDRGSVTLVRPLLGWRKAELEAIVRMAGVKPIDDPTNRDPSFDRAKARATLGDAEWIDPARMAAAASHLREADDALDWALAELSPTRIRDADCDVLIDTAGLPREFLRRLLLAGFDRLGSERPDGPELASALDRLRNGDQCTLGGVKLEGGPIWRLSVAPPRRRRG